MTSRLPGLLCLVALLQLSAVGQAQNLSTTDARDYEGAGAAPDNTVVFTNYLRHTTTSGRKNVTANTALFRVDYLKRVGRFALLPISLTLPVADADLRLYPGVPAAGQTTAAPTTEATGPASIATVHAAGIGDLLYVPTVLYDVVENAENFTHSYVALSTFVSIPTGSYKHGAPLNIGENRWSFKPQLLVGQRLFKVLTLEALASATFYRDNTELLVHPTAKTTAFITEKQRPTYGGEVHLGVDVHPSTYISVSYYLFSIGEQSTATATVLPHSVVQTMRFNWGIQLSPVTRLYVQLQQDLKTTAESANGRFVGARVSHVIF